MKQYRRELRLVARKVYAVAGNVARGARSVRATVRRRIDLPRNPACELVPGVLDGAERPGSVARGASGTSVAHQVSGGGYGGEFVVVATTRPETMLGDTAVAVHPEDERYKHLVGKKALLPLMNREIPIIADEMVDREFGTGAVKITPAHDPNDFETGRRHKLPEIDVMTDDGHMNANAGAYAGLDRFAARKKVVEDLKALGLLEKVTEHTHAIGICERSKTIVEPRTSTQWFCKMKPLAEPAIAAVERGEIQIVPENRRQEYLNWMRNIRDWTLSRQLWWGHRIPAWYCKEDEHITVAREAPAKCGDVRLGEPETGSGRAGHLVQLGTVAVFHAGLAGKNAGLTKNITPRA